MPQQCLKNRKHTVLVRTVIVGIPSVGFSELEGLGGLSRLLGEIRVMVRGLMSVMMTGMIIWVLVVLASHDGVRRKAEKGMGMGRSLIG